MLCGYCGWFVVFVNIVSWEGMPLLAFPVMGMVLVCCGAVVMISCPCMMGSLRVWLSFWLEKSASGYVMLVVLAVR